MERLHYLMHEISALLSFSNKQPPVNGDFMSPEGMVALKGLTVAKSL